MRGMRVSPEHRHTICLPRRLFYYSSFAILLLASIPPARAQQSPIDAAAAHTAEALAHAKQKSVIVFDFTGPEAKVTQLGRALADDFSAALEKSAPGLRVAQRSRITDAIQRGDFALELISDAESTLAFAGDLHVDALVMGQLSIDRRQVAVTVSSYRVRNGKGIAALRVTWNLTEKMGELATKDLTAQEPIGDLASIPLAGKNYTPASCIQCARPEYSRKAMENKIQGVVELQAVVTEDGRIRDIRVVKGLPFGLTLAAINVVKQWKLTPATDPDGKPAAVRQLIEVSFRIF